MIKKKIILSILSFIHSLPKSTDITAAMLAIRKCIINIISTIGNCINFSNCFIFCRYLQLEKNNVSSLNIQNLQLTRIFFKKLKYFQLNKYSDELGPTY